MKGCSYPGCEEEDSLPFKCKLCSQYYCAKHRLPEQHDCPKIALYQSDEYKKAKVSPIVTRVEEPLKRIEHSDYLSPRDAEQKSIFFQPRDRFLLRSPMFSLFSFRYNSANILVATFYVFVIMSIHFIIDQTLFKGASLNIFAAWIVLTYFISIGLIYGGHMVVENIVARNLRVRSGHVLWLQGFLVGLFSILIPFVILPSFLVFRDVDNKYKERGIVALAGIVWILFWQVLVFIFNVLTLAGIQVLPAIFLLGVNILATFFYIYLIFNLIPFGLNNGRYIANWNKKLVWYLFTASFIFLIVQLVFSFLTP
ncbi:MAG: AN1-type zinc finger domain-containing protein [Candidatus Thorarchaeota archaeon]